MAESAHSALTGANLHNVKEHNHDADTEAGGGKLSGAVVDTFVDVAEAAAPGTPAAGHVRFYAKSDGAFYQKDDAGLETGLAGGGSLADHNHTAAGGDGGDLDGAVVGDFVEFAEAAAPSTPASGFVRLYAKADGSFYQKDDAGLETGLAGGGGGGDSTLTDVYASRPAASNDGNLFLPSDGYQVERDTGSVYAPWGPLFPFTAPVDGDFAWINQGAATVSTTKGGIHLATTAVAPESLRIRKKAAPATPYTITAAIISGAVLAGAGIGCGLCFRQSSDGKLATLSLWNGTTLEWDKYNSPTAFSATYGAVVFAGCQVIFLRIADNGTSRILSYSLDGQNFISTHTVGRTDFLTANEVGFWVSANASFATGMTLLSWKEA